MQITVFPENQMVTQLRKEITDFRDTKYLLISSFCVLTY